MQFLVIVELVMVPLLGYEKTKPQKELHWKVQSRSMPKNPRIMIAHT